MKIVSNGDNLYPKFKPVFRRKKKKKKKKEKNRSISFAEKFTQTAKS